MAADELEEYDDIEMLEGEEDNAKALTTGLVITTTVMMILAFVFMEMALAHWFGIGPFV
jgi:hypothetical protein